MPSVISTDFGLLSKTRIRKQYIVNRFERNWVKLYFRFGRLQSVRVWVFGVSMALRTVLPSLKVVSRSFRKKIDFYAFFVYTNHLSNGRSLLLLQRRRTSVRERRRTYGCSNDITGIAWTAIFERLITTKQFLKLCSNHKYGRYKYDLGFCVLEDWTILQMPYDFCKGNHKILNDAVVKSFDNIQGKQKKQKEKKTSYTTNVLMAYEFVNSFLRACSDKTFYS